MYRKGKSMNAKLMADWDATSIATFCHKKELKRKEAMKKELKRKEAFVKRDGRLVYWKGKSMNAKLMADWDATSIAIFLP